MKERPILFSAPMVRAILDGSKTQTRRIVKPQPRIQRIGCDDIMTWCGPQWWMQAATRQADVPEAVLREMLSGCPYGQPRDRLWVRETHSFVPDDDEPTGCSAVLYAADGNQYGKLRPSIHMPRWASRILLEVTGMRVERLQDISEADAIAEGISVWHTSERHGIKWRCPEHIQRFGEGDNVEDVCFEGHPVRDPREAYRGVWSSINGPGSWEANPWVWIVEFHRIDALKRAA